MEGNDRSDISRLRIEYVLNGCRMEETVNPGVRLLDHLREEHGLLSVKEGCGTGECGACTVIVDGRPVCSCLIMMGQIDGSEVLTLEGLEDDDELHPIKRAFIDAGAVQCGFCTPGMILTAKALLDGNPGPTEAEVRENISGNLCRCTGYTKIIKAIMLAAEMLDRGGGDE